MPVTPSNFFRRILSSEALVYKSYFFRTAVLRILLDIRFSYNHCNISRACLLVKMASKQGLLTPQPWNKSFTHFEHRAGAVGREGLVNKSQSSLLNFYFRLSGFQSSLLLIHYNPLVSEYCLHCTRVWLGTYPICNAHSIDRHGAAFLRCRNLAKITILKCEHTDASSSVLFLYTKSSFLSLYSNTKFIIPIIGS